MVLIHSWRGGTRWTPSLVYELSRSHSGPGVQIQHAHTPSSSRGYSCLVSGFQPCGTLQSCHPTTHREVRSVSCPPPHHLQECWPEPPLSARVGGGSVPPSHVEAPLRSAQPRPWSSPVACVSPGDLRDFPWSLEHRLADAISQGSAKAGEPKCREEHSHSPWNLAMSCRSEATKTTRCTVGKSPAMRCRPAPRLALT
jgi:hypothetical protein